MILELKSEYLPIFSVPYPRNENFTGQMRNLDVVHKHLVLEAKGGFTSSHALYGLGGIGKTQIAIEYAYSHREQFDVIYWLRADHYETLVTSYVQLAQDPQLKNLIKFNREEDPDHKSIANQIRMWFEGTRAVRWMLISDNVDKLRSDIVALIPIGSGGCVLVTSRNRWCNG